MDFLTSTTAFTTIVGLLCNFKAERSSGEISDFILWLKEKRHDDVAARIEDNLSLTTQLTEILSTNHEVLIQKLASLDELVSSIATHVESLSGLAKAIHPHAGLSNQALSVLRQLVDSGAKFFMEHKLMTGEPNAYKLMDRAHGPINYDEPRFIDDDLETLVRFGLLRLEYASQGSRRFLVTREAIRFIQQ
ncbi:hypothetical protein [Aeromonas hydrophila]|uniref:hypothetical protein n=1 Tax=Aeromonas hydrophila TaxID=644 RepID=UPI002B4738BE|nr:hypothetical protein [Aeromonas hydrophila]